MYKFLTKNGQSLAFGIGVLVTVLFLLGVLPGVDQMPASGPERYETGIFNFGLYAAIVLTILAAIAMVAFGLYHVSSNFKGSARGIIGFVVLAGVFVISYATASGEADSYIGAAIEKISASGGEVTPNNLKFISGGITTALILTGVAGLAFVVSEIRNFFK